MTKKVVEVKRMTFAEASEKLSEIAAGKYHAIKFELARSPGGCFANGREYETTCMLYIDGRGHVTGPDWETAIQNLNGIAAVPQPMEISPTGNPTEIADDEPDH